MRLADRIDILNIVRKGASEKIADKINDTLGGRFVFNFDSWDGMSKKQRDAASVGRVIYSDDFWDDLAKDVSAHRRRMEHRRESRLNGE